MENGTLRLYHAGFQEIRTPDIRAGRKNADFAQGFYLSDSLEFALRWARERRGAEAWLNVYDLSTEGLRIRRFERDGDWYDYIFQNRSGYEDSLAEYDVIAGPIANDTLYDTLGILTSGLLSREQALRLLQLGPRYDQAVLKTRRAADNLRLTGSRVISPDEIAACREAVRQEEQAYQAAFSRELEKLLSEGNE